MTSLRRLAKDHASLRQSLPPYYVFPSENGSDSLPDDLTQLFIYLTGSDGTPFSAGLWLLHLRIPPDYPKSPPKATFKTRIFHPNVDESSGAVCLETLKRDWDPKLTLKDILITISCLLIHPNPDSALNEKAGVLVREDYDGFVKQARLMTKIHASIPSKLRREVEEARDRGEARESTASKPSKKKTVSPRDNRDGLHRPTATETYFDGAPDLTKENEHVSNTEKSEKSLSETKGHVLGKRPLTETMIPIADTSQDAVPVVLSSNQVSTHTNNDDNEPPRKSPKHTHTSQANGRQATPEIHGILGNNGCSAINSEPLFSAAISQQDGPRRPLLRPTKYRTYARIGIKRL